MLEGLITDATCGEACWEAREDVCRCSCGGRNHGCMRTADGTRPERTAKIDGYRYTLLATGGGSQYGPKENIRELYKTADTLNKAAGPRVSDWGYSYTWRETDKGAPARIRTASKDQIAKWPELAGYRDLPRYESCYLLWQRTE